jgi:hypothetical protein
MNQPSKAGKRIVSKGEYVANRGKKMALTLFGAAIVIIGLAGAAVLFAPGVPVLGLERSPDTLTLLFGVGILGIGCVGSLALLYYGGKAVKDAVEMDAGVPLTRANTSDLRPSDSLVRASEEPAQNQAAILLRAATHGQETPQEEMVRASIEPQNK